MKLSGWARGQGVSYRTALSWFHAGTLPVSARQLPTGTILVGRSAEPSGKTVAYCGVSSVDQRDDGERQAGRVAEEAGTRGITLDAAVTEVGSGVNGDRAELWTVLADPRVSRVVVGRRDRLARFGVEHLEAARAATGRRILVVTRDEVHDDLVRDVIEVLTSLCARLCARRSGRRSARRRAEAGVRCATGEVVTE